MNPVFTEEVLEKKDNSVIMRDKNGVIAQRYLNDVDENSCPHFLRFPVDPPKTGRR